MREYDELEVDTFEEVDMFLPGMHVLIGDNDHEWTVEKIEPTRPGYKITVYREVD